MVSSSEYYDFFAALVDRDPNGLLLPLKIGAAMRSDEYGAFGLAWKSAPNLRGSFTRAERYGHVLGSAETYSLEETAQGTLFNLEKAGDGSPGMVLLAWCSPTRPACRRCIPSAKKSAPQTSFQPAFISSIHQEAISECTSRILVARFISSRDEMRCL
ncbi:putative transcriptional regulator (fragment) [Marinobacter nauticus ATCC 49840]